MTKTNNQLTTKDRATEFLLYTSPNSEVKVEVFLHNENLWLTQDRIAEIFGVDRTVATKHLRNIYEERELEEISTSAKIAQVQKEGSREVKREIKFYNLDAIIAVGYRVNSGKATQFRIWATKILKDYIIKGFAMDDDRLKQEGVRSRYFEELLQRIRDIRSSERNFFTISPINIAKSKIKTTFLILTVK
ncbi:MAG: RhuM family protein [Candidatus Moraniibacteriota bacterium]